MTKLEFVKGMTQLASYYLKEINEEVLRAWYPFFEEIPADTFFETIKTIAINNKFFPNINELIERCEQQRTHHNNKIIDILRDNGYFKYGVMGELDINQQILNYEKAQMWVERGTIPSFLLEEMKKYGYIENSFLKGDSDTKALENKNVMLIGG